MSTLRVSLFAGLVAVLPCSHAQGAFELLPDFAHGEVIEGQDLGGGITVTSDGGGGYSGPGVIAFDSTMTSPGPDPDLRVDPGILIPTSNLLTVQEDNGNRDADDNNDGIIDVPNDEVGFTITLDFAGTGLSLSDIASVYDLVLVDLDRGGAMEATFNTADGSRTFDFPNRYTTGQFPGNFQAIDLDGLSIPTGPGSNGDDAELIDTAGFDLDDALTTATFDFRGSGAFTFALRLGTDGVDVIPEPTTFVVWSLATAALGAVCGRRRG